MLYRSGMTTPPSNEIALIVAQALQAARHELDAGQVDQAEALYRAVLELEPGHGGAHHALGLLARQAGDLAAAVPHFAAALQGDPGHDTHWLAYIEALLAARQFATAAELIALGRRHGLAGDALDALERQLVQTGAPDPGLVDAAVLLFSHGRLVEANQAARALIERFPQHPFGWKLLGGVLHLRGDLQGALPAMHTATTLAPDDAEALSNLGMLLIKNDNLADAEQVLQRSIALQPDNVNTHSHLANALLLRGRPRAAHAAALAALALDPDHNEAGPALASSLERLGQPREALAVYRDLLARNPAHHELHSNMLFCMSQMSEIGPAELLAQHQRYGQEVERHVTARTAWDNVPDPERPLRIGFVSADLRNHAVANFIAPLLEQLAGRPGVVLHAYYNHPLHDAHTERLRGHIAHWRDVAALDDDALDALIRADGVDILIDLGGHTSFNRLPLFARKPAPVQVSWIGYPGTTGLTTMDYYLAERIFLPPGRYDAQFTEKLAWLPLFVPFRPVVSAPDVGPLPALANGHITFGSFNRLAKFNSGVMNAWGRLLRALPTSRLLVAGLPEYEGYAQLRAWLEHEGIGAERVQFHGRVPVADYLALHNRVDICLDTFPYGGGTTTLYAGWMGVPTLTLDGGTVPGRQTAASLEYWGLSQFVAHDADDFLARGLAACADLEGLATLRATLRSRFPQPASGTVTLVADCFEHALRMMWQRWCQGLPAESVDVPLPPMTPTSPQA